MRIAGHGREIELRRPDVWSDEPRAQELVTGCEFKVIVEAPGHEAPPAPVPLAFAR